MKLVGSWKEYGVDDTGRKSEMSIIPGQAKLSYREGDNLIEDRNIEP